MSGSDITAVVIWILLVLFYASCWAYVAGRIAQRRGLHVALYAVGGFFFGPIAVILAATANMTEAGVARQMRDRGLHQCPNCWQWVHRRAGICGFCGLNLYEWHQAKQRPIT